MNLPLRKTILEWLVITALLACQLGIWSQQRSHLNSLSLVDEPPTLNRAKILALGDEEFYFRYLALYIQNTGTSFGRYESLADYDYAKLIKWFYLLDQLNHKSQFAPFLAGYYYSASQEKSDVEHVLSYLESHYQNDRYNKWWWMAQAAIIAHKTLKNQELAIKYALEAAATPNYKTPRWVQQLPAILYAEYGMQEKSLNFIQHYANTRSDLNDKDVAFLTAFIQKKLGYKDRKLNLPEGYIPPTAPENYFP